MFEHALLQLNQKGSRLPSQTWLSVYDNLVQAIDPDGEPWSYVPVPIWVKLLGDRYFGLRIQAAQAGPFAEAGDVLVVWMGNFGSAEGLLGDRNLWVTSDPYGALRLTEDLEEILCLPQRRLGLVLAVLRPLGQSAREFEVVFELPSAAALGRDCSWVR